MKAIERLYMDIARAEADRHGVRVTKWRGKGSGYADPERRLVESERPSTLHGLSLFLHEVGHCVNGRILPVWWDEWIAWKYAIRRMEEEGLPSTIARELLKQNMEIEVNSALRKGFVRYLPDWLIKEAGLDPGRARRRWDRRGRVKRMPDFWEPCPKCARRDHDRRKRRLLRKP